MAGLGALDLHVAAEAFLAVAVDALDTLPDESPTLAGAPDRQYVSTGAPVIDCDQVVVWVGGIGEAPTRPEESNELGVGDRIRSGRVSFPLLTVMVARCGPVISSRTSKAVTPTAAQLDAFGRQTNADAWALWCGLYRGAKEGRFNDLCDAVAFGRAEPLPPVGGYGGWQIPVDLQLQGYRIQLGS